MTPQEKLAAQLRAHASDCRKAADLNTDVVLQFDQLAAMAEAMDSAAATLLSEHGEVTITTDAPGRCVAVTRQDSEGRILSTIWEASEHGGGGEAVAWMGRQKNGLSYGPLHWSKDELLAAPTFDPEIDEAVPLYTTPPTPSAPDRVNCVECEGEGFTYGDDGETTIPCLPCGGSGLQKAAPPSAPVGLGVVDELLTNIKRSCVRGRNAADPTPENSSFIATFDHIEDLAQQAQRALSGSAPVGVEGLTRWSTNGPRTNGGMYVDPAGKWVRYDDVAALTPAAAPRAEEPVSEPYKSAASEDGEVDGRRSLERLKASRLAVPHADDLAAVEALIDCLYRRLAASGQVGEDVQDACDSILNRLEGWSKAYPLDVFPEPTKEQRDWLHATRPGLMDRIAASMGRHMAARIAEDLKKLRNAITTPPAAHGAGHLLPDGRRCVCDRPAEHERLLQGLRRREQQLGITPPAAPREE